MTFEYGEQASALTWSVAISNRALQTLADVAPCPAAQQRPSELMVNESQRAPNRTAASRAVSDVTDRKTHHVNSDLGERRIVRVPSPDEIVSGRFSAFRNTEQIRNNVGNANPLDPQRKCNTILDCSR